mgnify:CR=1 FL=1
MNSIHKISFFVLLIALATGLSGCPPLNHKIYLRNTSPDTARLTFIYSAPLDTFSTKKIFLSSKNDILSINKHTRKLLTDTLLASAEGTKINLVIAPKTTVYLSELINAFYLFNDKTLYINNENKTDTIEINYPYKHINGMKRKRDPAYNYFYRTIIYYDIK